MTVKELKEELDKLPDDMQLKCYSDYNPYTGSHSVKNLDIYFERKEIYHGNGYGAWIDEVAVMQGEY